MNFTDDQLNAFYGLSNFIAGNLDMIYLVNGSAGTGKTSVISQFINGIPSDVKVCAAAPTHKAISVIREKCRCTNKKTHYKTIHHLLRLTADYNTDGQTVFDTEDDLKYFHEYDVIFIDESSMISQQMYQLLKRYSQDTNTQIIFIGDSFQLPPIGEQMSKVFSTPDSSVLVEIVRAKSDVLMECYSRFRNYVATNHIEIPREWNKSAGPVRRLNNAREFEKLIAGTFNAETDHVLAFSRAKVAHYNALIRKRLFNGTTQRFVAGEVLVFDNYCRLANGEGSWESFHTSDQIVLENVNIVTRFHDKFKQFFKVYELVFLMKGCFTVYIIHEDDAKKYAKYYTASKKELLELVKKENWNPTSTEWGSYNFNKELFLCPLIYSYAQTCHKSQGSTYERVFVDVINIRSCAKDDPTTMRHCMYTAVMRASEHLTLLF